MSAEKTIPATDEAWEARELGADESFAQRVDEDESSLDESLELQMISIRLHKSLIEDFKLIASLNGLGYQTLMRQILKRFADSEKKRIFAEAVSAAVAASKQANENNDKSRKVA